MDSSTLDGSSPDGPARTFTVAVVLGRSGTVFSDALAPYEVFALSPHFSVCTVAESLGPAPVQAGPAVVAQHTWADIAIGAAPSPDVVVVPAVVDPYGPVEALLRDWLVEQVDRGVRVLGVCAGARVLAAAGLLEGRTATSHWSRLSGLRKRHSEVRWVAGERYVQDGSVTTTAGITSGIPGALRVVADLAGDDEAERVGRLVRYPGWTLDGSTQIPASAFSTRDLPLAVRAALGRFRPTVGVGLTDGVGEVDVASAFETSHVSFAARPVPVAVGEEVSTRHGLRLRTVPLRSAPRLDRLVVPGARCAEDVDPRLRDWAVRAGVPVEPLVGPSGLVGFDGALEHLARHTGPATARSTAKMLDYPTGHLELRREDGPVRRPLRAG